MPTQHYKVVSARLSLAEYWRMSPNPIVFSIAAVWRRFGGVPMTVTVPVPDELEPMGVDAIPHHARVLIDPKQREVEELGFRLALAFTVSVLEPNREIFCLVHLSPDGEVLGRTTYAREGAMEKVVVSMVSVDATGHVLGVTGDKKTLDSDPRHMVAWCPGLGARELLERHRRLLDAWRRQREPLVLTPETLPEAVIRIERQAVEFHVSRGVLVPMTGEDVQKALGLRADLPSG